MIQSAVTPKWQTLAGTTIAFILGFALVMFVLNIDTPKVSASSNDPTSILALSNTAGSLVIEVAPRIAVNQVGDPHTVVATVTTTGSQPVANATVNFKVIVGPTAGFTGSATTDSNGQAPFIYTSSSTGIDIIQACITGQNSGQACDLAVKWWVGSSPEREIDLSPDSASNPVGTSHTVTATLSEEGSPLGGTLVVFEILAGPNVGLTVSAATDSNGEAPFTYSSAAAGVDTIQACASDGNSGRVCDQARKQWTSSDPVRTLDLSPASSSNPVGTSHTVTATVADGGIPLSGALVVFEILSGPTAGVTGSVTTNNNGEAPFTYTGAATGLDTIQACTDGVSSGRVCDQATKQWTSVNPVRTLYLAPERASNPVGTSHAVTATVADGGIPLSGALVVFEILSGPTVGVTGSVTTDSSGEAPFTYTGTATGLDTIQACTNNVSSGRVCDQALKQWTSLTPDRFINLEPARATNPVGTRHTVTASVTEGDQRFPSHGVLVNFEVISGPTVGVSGSATTDSNGEAPFTYTGTATGLDTIQACTDDGISGRVCDLAVKRWNLVDRVRTLDLSPERASNPVGTNHTITATVADGDLPVSGALVVFEVVRGPTAGITGSATTNSSGEAPFTYAGTATGLDTIRACTSNGDARICDRAIKRWTKDQSPPDGTSCRGENSCRGRIVSVGANSCNAENSCNGNSISIGDNSCNKEDSCRGNTNRIGNGSCNGEKSCRGNNQRIGDGSCNDEEACRGNRNQIGDGSCNGEEACKGNNMVVADNRCNQDEACRNRGDDRGGNPRGDEEDGDKDGDEGDGESRSGNSSNSGGGNNDNNGNNKGKGNKGGKGRD